MENQRILTMTDKANLLKELEELKIAKQEVTEEIKIARGFGDLSENAEYTDRFVRDVYEASTYF